MTSSTIRSTIRSTSAELLRLRKWSATWVVVGAWLVLAVMFGYLFNYLAYTTGTGMAADKAKPELLTEMMPGYLPHVLVQGMPMFGGALAMVLGALVAGNGFGWGTWKTVFTQGPSRLSVMAGSLLATTVFVVVIVVLQLVVYLGISFALAGIEDGSTALPTLGSLAQSFGGGVLVLEMWALLGYAVGVLAKGPALAVGLGLVWSLVVENLLRGVGALLDVVEKITHVLPGTAAGSLVGAIVGDPGGTPGVLKTVPGDQALLTVSAYVVGLVALILVVTRRRDLT